MTSIPCGFQHPPALLHLSMVSPRVSRLWNADGSPQQQLPHASHCWEPGGCGDLLLDSPVLLRHPGAFTGGMVECEKYSMAQWPSALSVSKSHAHFQVFSRQPTSHTSWPTISRNPATWGRTTHRGEECAAGVRDATPCGRRDSWDFMGQGGSFDHDQHQKISFDAPNLRMSFLANLKFLLILNEFGVSEIKLELFSEIQGVAEFAGNQATLHCALRQEDPCLIVYWKCHYFNNYCSK